VEIATRTASQAKERMEKLKEDIFNSTHQFFLHQQEKHRKA
jgi:hypothetical protein